MPNRLIAVLLSALSLTLTVASPSAFAQSGSAGASAPAAQSDKKIARAQQKAERKAERKAAHAKNKKEIGSLQKNGYDQTSDNTGYPANIQHAQKKAADAVPASAP